MSNRHAPKQGSRANSPVQYRWDATIKAKPPESFPLIQGPGIRRGKMPSRVSDKLLRRGWVENPLSSQFVENPLTVN